MELTPAQREALTAALHDVRADVADRIVEYATTMWEHLGDWRDGDIAQFVSVVVPQVEAGKRTVAQATDAYIAAMIDDDPVGVVDLSMIRGGVPATDVYERPGVAMRSALSEGKSFTDALAVGARRLESLIRTDLQLAHTHQARASMGGAMVPGSRRRRKRSRGAVEAFRRVPTGRENCALCLIASTQRYWVGDLMPIHPGCDCGVAPLGKGEHLDQVIDAALLEATHEQVERLAGISNRSAEGYRNLIVTRQHGEYGPTLAWRAHRWSSQTQRQGDTSRVSAAAQQAAANLAATARQHEPVITTTMHKLADDAGGRLVGLDFRVKAEESLARKIEADAAKKGVEPAVAAEAISDALRYTLELAEDVYTRNANATLDALRAAGYKARVKNYWTNDAVAYQGVNVALVTPSGQQVELQIHTPTSFRIKEGVMHQMYEEYRTLASSDTDRHAELEAAMRALAGQIPVPPDVAGIR